MIKEIFIKGRSFLYKQEDGKTIVYFPNPVITKKRRFYFFGKWIIIKTFKEMFTIKGEYTEKQLKLFIRNEIRKDNKLYL